MSPSVSSRPITTDEQRLAEHYARGRVLLIDQDTESRAALHALIHRAGYACERYPSAAAYLQTPSEQKPAFSGPCCALCDVRTSEFHR